MLKKKVVLSVYFMVANPDLKGCVVLGTELPTRCGLPLSRRYRKLTKEITSLVEKSGNIETVKRVFQGKKS